MPANKKIKYFKAKVRSIDPTKYTAEVVISSEVLDRHGERVLASSFKKTIKSFMEHPVLLSSHAYRGLMNQIGEFEKIKIEGNEVVARPKWYVGEGNPEADWGWKLAEKGIAAFSIGFIPVSYVEHNDEESKKHDGSRCDYTEIELLETSQVLIPANPSALQRSFDSGVVSKEMEEEIQLFLKELNPDDPFLKELEDIETLILEKVAEEEENKEKFSCECIKCSHKVESAKHCSDIKCPKCGGEMRRVERPGPGKESDPQEEVALTPEQLEALEIEAKKWEETEKEIRHRLKDPSLFEKFRYTSLKKTKPRVNGIYGKYKGKDEWAIQSLRFPKADGWTMAEAKKWYKDHPIKEVDVIWETNYVDFDEEGAALSFEDSHELEMIVYVDKTFLRDLKDMLIEIRDGVNALSVQKETPVTLIPADEKKETDLAEEETPVIIPKEGDSSVEAEEEDIEDTVSPEKLKEMSDGIRLSLGLGTEEANEEAVSYVKEFVADINQEMKKIFSVPPSGKEQ